MIGLLLAAALQTSPVIETSPPPGASASPARTQPRGILVGCVFPTSEPGQAKPSFSGIAMFLPEGMATQPLAGQLIADPSGILGQQGFEHVHMTGSSFHFAGRNSLAVRHKSGGIYSAELATHSGWKPKQPGACQVGNFERHEEALGFFTDLLAGMNSPEADGR